MPAKKISINVARVVETHQPHESHQSSKPFQVFYKIGIRALHLSVIITIAVFIRITAVVALFSIRMRRALLQNKNHP